MRNEVKYNGKTYTDDSGAANKLLSASVFVSDSFTADTLAADTMSMKVQDLDNEVRILTYDGYPVVDSDGYLLVAPKIDKTLDKFYKYGDEITLRHDGTLVGGRFRIEEIERIAASQYSIKAVSDIGLLLSEDHYGGLYNGVPVSEVLKEIIGGIFEYTLDPVFGSYLVYGLLRKKPRRINLRNLLFAMGGQIRKDENGKPIICAMPDPIPYSIVADHIYTGGSVTNGKPATGIDLTEHNFAATENDVTVTLFDGVASAVEMVTPKGEALTGVLIVFQEPVHDLVVSNSEILESDVNYAVISGSPAAVLTGKQYTHTTRIVSRRLPGDGKPNVIPSSACELVNVLNAELVADRLMAYYGAAKKISADIVLTNQKTGDAVTFTDPFGDSAGGYIGDMSLTISATVKARATVISGFAPTGSGNYYTNVIAVTEDGTVTIPAEAKDRAQIVLIGGGFGGGLGNPGEDAPDNGFSTALSTAGAGGLPGIPGAGGKIFVKTIEVKPGDVFEVKIGKGGKGATTSTAAEEGGATTFGDYTSSDGYSSDVGYANIITGEVVGILGEKGISGGRGNDNTATGETITFKGVEYKPGSNAGTVSLSGYYATGGYGGGAAAGANGNDGSVGSVKKQSNGSYFASGGDGARGATPVKADNGEKPGQGGQAGHGGGGGGIGGTASGSSGEYQEGGSEGKGGYGGEGGDGADGIIYVFF